jgi:hypothetical protein
MDDALLVRGLEGRGDLFCDGQGLLDRDRADDDTVSKRRAFDELQYQCPYVVPGFSRTLVGSGRALFQAEDCTDMRMAQRGQHLRFALEAREAFGVRCEGVGKNLQRDVATQPPVARAIDLTHAPGAQRARHLVGAEPRPDLQGHSRGL